MTSRKDKIIALAVAKSNVLLGAVPERRQRALANLNSIKAVCQQLVNRRTPQLPSVKLICEEGANKNEAFPTVQTVYNDDLYTEMVSIWRKAYRDIQNIDALDPIPLDELDQIDVSILDEGTRFIVDELRQHIKELTQRCNALKRIISESVPVSTDNLPETVDAAIDGLNDWLSEILDSPFVELDEIGLRVSRRASPGTVIMFADLFGDLKGLVEVFLQARKAGAAA